MHRGGHGEAQAGAVRVRVGARHDVQRPRGQRHEARVCARPRALAARCPCPPLPRLLWLRLRCLLLPLLWQVVAASVRSPAPPTRAPLLTAQGQHPRARQALLRAAVHHQPVAEHVHVNDDGRAAHACPCPCPC